MDTSPPAATTTPVPVICQPKASKKQKTVKKGGKGGSRPVPCSKSDSCLSLSSYSASGGEMDVDNPSSVAHHTFAN